MMIHQLDVNLNDTYILTANATQPFDFAYGAARVTICKFRYIKILDQKKSWVLVVVNFKMKKNITEIVFIVISFGRYCFY